MIVKANPLRTQTFLQDFATIYKNIDGISEGKGFRSPIAPCRLKEQRPPRKRGGLHLAILILSTDRQSRKAGAQNLCERKMAGVLEEQGVGVGCRASEKSSLSKPTFPFHLQKVEGRADNNIWRSSDPDPLRTSDLRTYSPGSGCSRRVHFRNRK